jgi:hypothetical protein
MAFVIITPALTGHTHYRSPYESYDNCGTCDGARCETCREMYEVADFDSDNRYKIVATKEEAEQIKELWEKS